MMYTECLTPAQEINACGLYEMVPTTDDVAVVEDCFATAPMPAITPLFQQPDEDELHAAFEEAISNRTAAISRNMSRIYSLPVQRREYHTEPELEAVTLQPVTEPLQGDVRPALLGNGWQRVTNLACIGGMLMMAGFDLMGMLMLHMH